MTDNVSEPDTITYTVAIPSYGLGAEAQQFGHKIVSLTREADTISVLNPIWGYFQWRSYKMRRAELAPEYSELLGRSLGALANTVTGAPGIMMAFFQISSTGEALASILLIQTQWQQLTGTLDRKAAFLIASLSIYISMLPLALTLIFRIASWGFSALQA